MSSPTWGKATFWEAIVLIQDGLVRVCSFGQGLQPGQFFGGEQIDFVDHHQAGFFDLLVEDIDDVLAEGQGLIQQAQAQQAAVGENGVTGR